MSTARSAFLVDAEETEAFAKALGLLCTGGERIALSGEMGAGKTTFVRGLASGLGIDLTCPKHYSFESDAPFIVSFRLPGELSHHCLRKIRALIRLRTPVLADYPIRSHPIPSDPIPSTLAKPITSVNFDFLPIESLIHPGGAI